MTDVIFAVDHHDEFDNFHKAGTTADLPRVQAGNLVYRGLARYAPQTPTPAPVVEEPAKAGVTDPKKSIGKE